LHAGTVFSVPPDPAGTTKAVPTALPTATEYGLFVAALSNNCRNKTSWQNCDTSHKQPAGKIEISFIFNRLKQQKNIGKFKTHGKYSFYSS